MIGSTHVESKEEEKSHIFVVIGSKGGLGLEVCRRLLERQETKEIRALCRVLSTVPRELRELSTHDPRLKIVIGDVTDPSSLEGVATLGGGVQAVFFCASACTLKNYQAVDELGVKNVAEVSFKAGVEKVLLVSSELVHPSNKWNPVRIFLNTITTGIFAKKSLMDIKYDGEQHLRKSRGNTAYVIVRPGHLVDGPLHQGIMKIGQTNGHFMSGKRSTRADVADLLVCAALSDACRNVTFECASTLPVNGSASAPAIEPEILFKQLDPSWDQQFLQ